MTLRRCSALGLLCGLAMCTPRPGADAGSSPATENAVADAQAGTPGAALPGVEPTLARRLDDLLRLTERGQGVAGVSLAVARRGQPVLIQAYGFADVLGNVPLRPDHRFRIGSITKTFTAAAILKLEAQGKLALEDPLTKYWPEYTAGRAVTLRHLLTHTSGVPSYTDLPWYAEHMAEPTTHPELLATFAGLPLKFTPGSQHSYSNSGYYLLGVVIEGVSGQSYADFLRTELFAPAGLTDTDYCPDEQAGPRAALGYDRNERTLAPAKPLSMTLPFAAGALCSTASDLVAWIDALSHGKVVPPAVFARMSQPTPLTSGKTHPYGLGLGLGDLEGHALVGHNGGINGFVSALDYYPQDELTIAVLVNTGSPAAGEIARHVARTLLDLKEPALLDLPISAEEAGSIVGVYEIQELGQTIPISFAQGVLSVGGQMRLLSQGNGVYVVKELQARLSFEREHDRVERMVVLQRGQRFVGQRKP
jgi:CubicO group peptidase (beta-lactamase class C family)